jgi:multidrug efflux pump subunit AcrA (membrane-fusion protein)
MQGMNERLRARFGRSTPLRILAIVLLIVLVGVAIFAGVYASRQPRPTFATAHIGNVILSVQTTGAIQATVYQADFPVDGALSQIDVTVGQQVHKGQAECRAFPERADRRAKRGERGAAEPVCGARLAGTVSEFSRLVRERVERAAELCAEPMRLGAE